MQNSSEPSPNSPGIHDGQLRRAWATLSVGSRPALIVALVYWTLSIAFTRYWSIFEIDPDEGNNLIKALLLDRGHAFATEIWSDQPPLFPYLLWGAFELFGWDVGVARSVVLATSAVLVFATYDMTRQIAARRAFALLSHLGACLAVGFLLLSSGFAGLRVSVMIGVPSLAFAALAFWAALKRHERSGYEKRWFLVSGASFAASLSIKLFTVFLLPFLIGCALHPELQNLALALRARQGLRLRTRELGRAGLLWGASFGFSLLIGMAPALRPGAWSQLYSTHALAEKTYKSAHSLASLSMRDWPLYLAAGLGAVSLVLNRGTRRGVWLVAWLVTAGFALSRHNPLWAHHTQLLVVPAAVLAGCALALTPMPLAERLGKLPGAVLVGAWCAAAALLLILNLGDRAVQLLQPYGRADGADRAALEALRKLGIQNGYIVSSRQIYAFYLGLPVPPALSVTSAKRFRSGGLGAATLTAEIHKYRAEVVVLSQRWPKHVRDSVRRALGRSYELVYQSRKAQDLAVYRRLGSDPAAPPSPTAEAR